MDKWKIILLAGAALALSGVLWLFVLQPGEQVNTIEAEQSLHSGIALYQQKKYPEAIEVLRTVPPGSSQEASARYHEGSAQMMLGDFESAIVKLEQALVLAPKDPGILYALGVASYKLGNIKLAKGYFAAVLEIDPMDEREEQLVDQARGLSDIMAKLERDPASVATPTAHGVTTTTDGSSPAEFSTAESSEDDTGG